MEQKNAAGDGTTERYTHGYDAEYIEKSLNTRTVSAEAAFFVPHLRPGMSLLDCGCGPGSITAGFASRVAPGQVVGLDIEASQIALARQQAEAQGIANVRFEVANAYEIPFPDESFDAVFAHTLLQHLADPVRALREIYRVLKPGGIVGLREEDNAGFVFSPASALMDQSWDLYIRTWQRNGGDPYFARKHRSMLAAAGFVQSEGFASASCYGTPEATRPLATFLPGYFAGHLQDAIALGWTTPQAVAEMGQAWAEWAERPDAYIAILFCEAIGWKP